MAGTKKGRVVSLGSAAVNSVTSSNPAGSYYGAHPRTDNNTVDLDHGDPTKLGLLNQALVREMAKADPLITRVQQRDIFAAWGRINARETCGFFGKVNKMQTAMICDFPGLFMEMALFVGKASGGGGVCDGNKSVRFGVSLDCLPEMIAAMNKLYKEGCIRYGVKIRPIQTAESNVSGYEDGNPTLKKG